MKTTVAVLAMIAALMIFSEVAFAQQSAPAKPHRGTTATQGATQGTPAVKHKGKHKKVVKKHRRRAHKRSTSAK